MKGWLCYRNQVAAVDGMKGVQLLVVLETMLLHQCPDRHQEPHGKGAWLIYSSIYRRQLFGFIPKKDSVFYF